MRLGRKEWFSGRHEAFTSRYLSLDVLHLEPATALGDPGSGVSQAESDSLSDPPLPKARASRTQ